MTDQSTEESSAGLETRNIFLDTEVYRSNGYNLNSDIMKLLGHYVTDRVFVLHTTDVTLREVKLQIDAMESDLISRANKIIRDLERWNHRYRFNLHGLSVPDALCAPNHPNNAYSDFEWTLRQDWYVQEHRTASLPIGPVLDQYFNRNPPFHKEGSKEFPDAFALLALKNWCASTQERMYVVSKDKAMQQAAGDCDCFIAVETLEQIFALVARIQDHEFAEAIWGSIDNPQFLKRLQGILSKNIGYVGCLYDGHKSEGEISSIEIVELEEIENVTVLRIVQDQASCIVHVRLLVRAEIDYIDLSGAMWDSEEGRYFGGEAEVAEIQDRISSEIFVELDRDAEEITLSSAHFLAQDLTVTEYNDDV